MSHTEYVQNRRETKPEKLPVVWVYDDCNYIGLLNASKGIAEKIRPDGKYEIHSGEDFNNVNNMIYTGTLPDITVGTGYCHNAHYVSPFPDELLFPANCISSEKIEAGRKEWQNQFFGFPEPRIAILLGGECASFRPDSDMMRMLAQECAKKAKDLGGSLIITTSKRTGQEAKEAFINEINKSGVPNYLYDWSINNGKNNPYFGILGSADAIIATGESRSMCSDANKSKKPVYIYDFNSEVSEYDMEFHQQLYARNVAQPFSEFMEHGIVPWEYEPLDTAGEIAREALKRWRAKQQQTSVNFP
jgi:hypothetical protein